MISIFSKVRTAWALGAANIIEVLVYRLSVRLGLNPACRLQAFVPQGPFFSKPSHSDYHDYPVITAWQKEAYLFSHWPLPVSNAPPDWLTNPFNGQRFPAPDCVWWKIPDFDPAVGDIKVFWELSRMDWVLAFAQRASQGDQDNLNRLNAWLTDWCQNNPPFKGPNWKCGQEASIRVMHLAMAALILGQVRIASAGLLELVRLHLQRIAPTLQYAIAQDNNHGTSEASALFIGGSWLAEMGVPEGEDWARTGRKILENRTIKLIGTHGSFSQYSLNYHRLMLDTLCMSEVWRLHLRLPSFSFRWQSHALAASEWLRHLVNPINGDGPNIGANDGARLLQLTNTSYRDYRPCVALSMALFAKKRVYEFSGTWEYALKWLGVDIPQTTALSPQSRVADDGGFGVFRTGDAMVLLRYPRFQFRPNQADALHLDLWIGQNNLLRDAGTYSYHAESKWLNYFSGTSSHNTVQFDDRDQMPRISRFLFCNWLKSENVQPLPGDSQTTHFSAGYTDRLGAKHLRKLEINPNYLRVIDTVQSFKRKAVLRWRIQSDEWQIESTPESIQLISCSSESAPTLFVSSTVPIKRCELVQGWESLHYLKKTPLQVLEIELQQSGTLTTQVFWPS